jgi:hypothetical protein
MLFNNAILYISSRSLPLMGDCPEDEGIISILMVLLAKFKIVDLGSLPFGIFKGISVQTAILMQPC